MVAAFAQVHFGRPFLLCALSDDKVWVRKTANARTLADGHGVHAFTLPQNVFLVDVVALALYVKATSLATAGAIPDAAAASTTTATNTTSITTVKPTVLAR